MSALSTLILGGSFDPPHIGHVEMASRAADLLQARRILVIPARQSPLRDGKPGAPPEARLELTRLAFAAERRAEVLSVEVDRPGASYTVDTLAQLQRAGRLSPDPALNRLLIGADQAVQFTKWKDWLGILRLVTPAILPRTPWSVESLGDQLRQQHANSGGPSGSTWATWILPLPLAEPSATAAREQIARGAPTAGLLSPLVRTEIDRLGLYRV